MGRMILVTWRDIPAQVIVKRGRETARAPLSDRFQMAIDRAAMRAGKGSSDAYLADWKRTDRRACGDDIEQEARDEAQRLEAQYSDADLERLIRSRGLENPAADGGVSAPAADAGADLP